MSELEQAFVTLLRQIAPDLPSPQHEYRFAPPRRWRFDFAWPSQLVAVELEGGLWNGGRHNRPRGYIADMDKYNAATVAGWRVLRYTGQHLNDNPWGVFEQIRTVLNR